MGDLRRGNGKEYFIHIVFVVRGRDRMRRGRGKRKVGGRGGGWAEGSVRFPIVERTTGGETLRGAVLASKFRRHDALLHRSCEGEGEMGRGVESAKERVPPVETRGGDRPYTGFALFQTGTGFLNRG
jgi:hypothetical protein